jgi:hypothetical protein
MDERDGGAAIATLEPQSGSHHAPAQGQLSAAQSEVPQIELDLTNRLAETYARYSNTRYQVEQYKKQILPDAKASFDIVSNGYQQGEFNFLVLFMAQRTFLQTNLLYLKSLRQLCRAEVEIKGLLLTSEVSCQHDVIDSAVRECGATASVFPFVIQAVALLATNRIGVLQPTLPL